jgi:hypothetical protein
MRRKYLLASMVGTLAVICASMVGAQDPRLTGVAGDQYVISAKAGGVNFVEGTATVIRKDGTSGRLVMGDSLEIGDRVTTGADGKAEILLNPGSYMRVGGNTSFEFVSTDLENLEVNLKSGSAVFEVIAANEFRVSIKTPHSEIALTRSGVFRLDVLKDGTAKLSVFKGKAYVGPGGSTEVESGRMAMLVKGGISVSKFDRDTNDPLDIWSKERGKEATKLNAKLQRNALRNTLLSSFNQGGWDMYNSFGLWIFDPMRRGWCFLPFGYGWSSPYGWGYDYDIWWCRLPWYVYNNPPVVHTPSGNTGRGSYQVNTNGNTSRGGSPVSANTSRDRTPVPTSTKGRPMNDRSVVPPFERIQRTGGGSGSVVRSNDDIFVNSGRGRESSPPMSAPPVYIPPVTMAPPPPANTAKGKP